MPNTRVMSVLAAHDGGPRGATQRVGHKRVLELHALGFQQRARLGHIFQVVFTHVVGEDEDEIGFDRGRLGLCRKTAKNGENE